MPRSVFSKVLVGWDGSTGAAAGLVLGLRLTDIDDGRLVALSVVPSYSHLDDADTRRAAVEEVRTRPRALFDDLVARHPKHPGQQVALEFVEADDVVAMLDEYATTHALELVIVGLHGSDGLLHPRMGHIASHAVRSVHCPVLVVPGPEGAAGSHHAGSSKRSSLFHPFHRDR